MSNSERKRSDYEFHLSKQQLEAFLKIAAKEDRSFKELIDEAIDRYIQREKETCQKEQLN
jgi:hypothetical protein